MPDMINWLKTGITDGYITSDDAMAWLIVKSKREEEPAAYPASSLQQSRGGAKARAASAPPRPRGRPRKANGEGDSTPPKPRGRPRKVQPVDPSSSNGVT